MKKNMLQNACLTLIAVFLSAITFAQDKQVDISTKTTTTTTNNEIWTSPWMWALGAAVFILLLVALMRNNKNSNT